MSNKDPAVLFYTSDFLSGVALMTMKERGQYITLLCLQRERGHMTMKEMEKAVGKLSDEVRGKFIADDGGKFYNKRMEIEVQKRLAHSQRQRENVSKRWNKQKDGRGINNGNTTVLPLGNGNGNENENIKDIDTGRVMGFAEAAPPVSPPDSIAAVLADYLDRINPSASQTSMDELRGYANVMGHEVCLRAMDIALDSKKAAWPYIRGILRSWQSKGVKCLADIERLDEKHEKERGANVQDSAGNSGKTWKLPGVTPL